MESINLIQISLAATGIINCFLVSLILFFARNGNLKANRLLGFLSLVVCLKLSYTLLMNIPHIWGWPSLLLYYLSESAYFSIGPLLLLYFLALIKREISTTLTLAIFIPFLFPFIGHFFDYDISLWQLQSYYLIFLIIIFVVLKAFFSNEQKSIHLKAERFWIYTLYGTFVFIWITVNLLFIDFKLYFLELTVIFTASFYINFYIILNHFWIRKGDVNEPQKYKNALLSIEEEDEILLKLHNIMETHKMYIDFEISLPKVASKIDSKPYKLSQVINKRLNMTFNEFINSYRVKAIAGMIKLPEYQDVKIASIAYDYGFNSISSFNTAFKKFTNCTPSEFRTNGQSY